LPAAAALREPATDDLLGDALAGLPAVDVRRIEEVDPELQRTVHDGEAVGLRGERAEVHGAETEATHLEPGAAEPDVLHHLPSAAPYHHCPSPRPSAVRASGRAPALARIRPDTLYGRSGEPSATSRPRGGTRAARCGLRGESAEPVPAGGR